MIRRRRTQIMHRDDKLMDWWAIILDVSTATTMDNTADPQIKLRYSNDAGRTFSDWMFEPLGQIGETEHRVVFRKLGIGRRRVWETECSENLQLTINAAYAEVEVLGD